MAAGKCCPLVFHSIHQAPSRKRITINNYMAHRNDFVSVHNTNQKMKSFAHGAVSKKKMTWLVAHIDLHGTTPQLIIRNDKVISIIWSFLKKKWQAHCWWGQLARSIQLAHRPISFVLIFTDSRFHRDTHQLCLSCHLYRFNSIYLYYLFNTLRYLAPVAVHLHRVASRQHKRINKITRSCLVHLILFCCLLL